MNDTELDDMLNQWKAPEPGTELRERVRSIRPSKRRIAWPSWHLGKGLIFGLSAGAAMCVLAVGVAMPQSFAGSIPFTVDFEYMSHKKDGSTVTDEYRTEYLRDGAPAILSSSLPDSAMMTLHNRVFYAVESLLYPLVHEIHGTSKKAVTPAMIANDCVRPGTDGFKVIAHEKVLGYDAAVILIPNPNDDGISKEWRSPALSCFVLRATWQNRQPDLSFRLTWEKRATKITINRPQ